MDGALNTSVRNAETDDEGMLSDYESEPEMSETSVLKFVENELQRNSTQIQ